MARKQPSATRQNIRINGLAPYINPFNGSAERIFEHSLTGRQQNKRSSGLLGVASVVASYAGSNVERGLQGVSKDCLIKFLRERARNFVWRHRSRRSRQGRREGSVQQASGLVRSSLDERRPFRKMWLWVALQAVCTAGRGDAIARHVYTTIVVHVKRTPTHHTQHKNTAVLVPCA